MDTAFRDHLARALEWGEAHGTIEDAAADLPAPLRGRAPAGLPYSPWQLLEHIRLAQHDILDFCRSPSYAELRWPDDYWPPAGATPTAGEVSASIAALREDREALGRLALDASIDLFARIPHGSGQTYLRELLLVIDHSSYHLGQMVAVRRALGIWD